MNGEWKKVKLGEVLRRSAETVTPEPGQEYSEITVRLWGNGVVQRGRIMGASVNGRRFIARRGQFIASRIDARNGAMGLVPESLDGALVTNDFPLFDVASDRMHPEYLGWLSKTQGFVERCAKGSEGTTNRVRLKEDKFLEVEIPLPPIAEQRRIVARIEGLAAQIAEARALREQEEADLRRMLIGAFWRVARNAPRRHMGDVAPLVRRPVHVETDITYPELGIRSFGKGTFHKPALSGFDLGTKRVFSIEPGDLLFSNVFAWEGAIAVAQPNDAGRIGSHRYMSCVPVQDQATSSFLCFYFLTDEGLDFIRAASPGGAGRNRTLGIQALARIQVPIPPLKNQKWFNALLTEVSSLKSLHAETAAELDALMPSILDRAFKGEL
ncbi:MAG: restriction endonuclease subunit S [Kiritimatiellae bacterium]|nr:restriction endonuclease subunit S [Kiritimatiellia bacterium]MDD4441073.1 restriction endonuclease subunit S [Kiritimatiellia bacterium]